MNNLAEIERIYHAVLEIPLAGRESFISDACGADVELRREIESLLSFDEKANSFIESPPDDLAASIVSAQPKVESLVGAEISQYRIVSLLGVGGMGKVYLAQDLKLDRRVALKILPAGFHHDCARAERFLREAQAASALNHPNICVIHEINDEHAPPFIVMEYVAGETLGDKIKNRCLDPMKTLDLAMQIADALAEVHAHSIIHRDIKPSNIIVNERGLAKILDFGLAKKIAAGSEDQIELKLSQAGVILGTVAYMSPEQARGQQIDARTDVWSLGVVLYEMLAGKPPFRGATTTDLLADILKSEPEDLSSSAGEIPPELIRIVSKCLAKDRRERYPSAREVLQDLKNVKADSDFQLRLKEHSGLISNERRWTVEEPPHQAAKTWRLGGLLALLVLAGATVFAYLYLTSASRSQIESIAVMPFVIQSHRADADYLTDGMTEMLINNLSQLPNVSVKARSSVFRYKGKQVDLQTVGRELNAQAILTGSLIEHGESLILNLELIDAQTENIIWSERYDRRQTDLAVLQSEIAGDVADKIKIKLSGADQAKVTKKYTTDPQAYQFYLKGRFYWNKRTGDDLKRAIEQFEAAAKLDPNFALAYVGLADSLALLEQYTGAPPSQNLPRAKAFAELALQIDDSLAEAHTSMGFIHYNLWQWAEAEKQFKRAIELNPNYPTAHHWYYIYLRDMRRFDEALAEIKLAQQLDPLSLVINISLTRAYLLTGDIDSFIEMTKKTMELYPNYSSNHSYLGLAYLKQGRRAEALAEIRRGVALDRSSSILAFLGYATAISGNRAEAEATISELKERYAAQQAQGRNIAEVYIGLGEKDQAYYWLERDFQIRSGDMSSINWLPTFDSLREEARFKNLLQRMQLEP